MRGYSAASLRLALATSCADPYGLAPRADRCGEALACLIYYFADALAADLRSTFSGHGLIKHQYRFG